MSDSPEPTWPGSREVEALVSRALAERVDPLRAQLTTVSRALAILAERLPPPQEAGQLSARLDALAAQIQHGGAPVDFERILEDRLAELGAKVSGAAMAEMAARADLAKRFDGAVTRLESSVAPVLALPDQLGDVQASVARGVEAALTGDTAARKVQADDLRQAVAAAVEDAVSQLDQARRTDTSRLLERIAALEAPLQSEGEARRAQTDELRQALGVAVSHAVAKVDQARAADADRLLERIAALEVPLKHDAEDRRAEVEELRASVTAAVDQSVARAAEAFASDSARVLERVASLDREAEARQAQADDFRQAVATAFEQAVGTLEAAVTTDTARVLERVAALEEPVHRAAELREAQAGELRSAVAETIEAALARIEGARAAEADNLAQALARMEAAQAAEATRTVELVSAFEAPLQRESEERKAQTDELRQALAVAVAHAVAKIDQARGADARALHEQVAALAEALAGETEARTAQATELRRAVAEAIEQADTARSADIARLFDQVAAIETGRTSDAGRLLEQVATLAEAVTRDAAGREAEAEQLRTTVAGALDRAISDIEGARAADATRVLEQVAGLAERAEAEASRRDAQATALLAAVDERLQALHLAGSEAGSDREDRLAARLEAVVAEQGGGLLARIDERTAAITDLQSIPPLVASEVRNATAAALTSQVQPLVARLVEAIDTLAHEGGRIEAMARAHAGEARAVEERVAALFVEVAERAESATDHSRARISEGQVALGTKFDALMGELLTSITAAADRLEARLAESAEGLRAAGSHQNGALLDAVNRSSQQVGEGLSEVRATVESVRHDPRLEALVVEQVAAREAQLTAIEAVSKRIDEVGPVVARALLSEVERATRAANAAEEAVASLRPEALRSALGDAAEEIRSAASRLDETIGTLGEQVGQGLASLTDSQAGIREKLAELQQPSDETTVARLEALDRSLAGELSSLAAAIAGSREELLALTTRAIEDSAALAGEVGASSGTALDDLRASQAALREAVQDGAHKAELAALDIRSLRERLTPHLEALADATTRRAEADEAGFDAILARLDQLLTARQR